MKSHSIQIWLSKLGVVIVFRNGDELMKFPDYETFKTFTFFIFLKVSNISSS